VFIKIKIRSYNIKVTATIISFFGILNNYQTRFIDKEELRIFLLLFVKIFTIPLMFNSIFIRNFLIIDEFEHYILL